MPTQSTLPHYVQSTASINKYEPVHPSLFEVTLLAPSGITFNTTLVLERVKSIGGLGRVNRRVHTMGQKFKFADRSYASMPGQTFVDLSLTFTLNLNTSNEMYIYKMLRDWYKQIYDPATGIMGLKVNYTGTIVVVQYNRAGDIFRQLTFKDAFPTGQITAVDELNYDTHDPVELNMTFRSDHWLEANT